MNRERWQVLSPLVERALELEEPQRAEFLAGLAREDPALAAELGELLATRVRADAEGFLAREANLLADAPTLAGQVLGAYVLEEPIGAGGMGSVWRARRSDGRFDAAVAVKLLNTALHGRGGEERFRREGTILARLRHPHIAGLLDAGVSALGQPYLILELVDGEPIDVYCDRGALDIEQRLRLFLDVLAAVSHAHANLVVHRDLKPSNVLVARSGEVKLLDFGIAKLLEGEAESGAATALTRDAGRVFTPEFAAPEQISGETITTATDVYSAGALLYLLLAGRSPTDAAGRAPADVMRAILETDAQKLSTTVADEKRTESAALVEAAARRRSTPQRLRRQLAGDLDTIVAKALKRAPAERYASVAEFTDDLRRQLAHEPIRARPDSLGYRTARFVRRHRLPVTFAAAACLALAAGAVGTFVQARRVERQAALTAEQRDLALLELTRAEAINELNSFLLTDAAPGGKAFTVGDLLRRAERIVGRQAFEKSGSQVELMIAVGRELDKQDEIARAKALLSIAYERATAGSAVATRARAACALAHATASSGDNEKAESLLAEGLASLPNESVFVPPRVECLRLGTEIAMISMNGEGALSRALEAKRLFDASGQGSPLLGTILDLELAGAYRYAGRIRESEGSFSAVAARLEALGYDDSEFAASLFNNWAVALRTLGRPLEAERLYRRTIEISSAREGIDSAGPIVFLNLGSSLYELQRFDEAGSLAERGLALARRQGNSRALTQALALQGRLLLANGKVAEAAKAMEELRGRVDRMPENAEYRAVFESQMGLLARARGDMEKSLAAHDRALSILGDDSSRGLSAGILLLRRSELLLEVGEAARALEDASRAVEVAGRALASGDRSFRVGAAYLARARALRALGDVDEARKASASAIEHLAPTLGAEHPVTREAQTLASQLATSPPTASATGTLPP